MCSFPVVCSPLCSCSESVFIISNRATKWPQWDFSRPSSKTANSISSTSSLLRGPRQRREDRKNLSSSLFKLTSAQSFVTRRTRWCLVCVSVFVWPYGLFLRFKEDPYVAAEGNTPEQGSRRGKYTHTHTPQFCAVAVVTQQLAGLGQQQIVDPPPSHVTPNMSSHTHTHIIGHNTISLSCS